MIAANEVPERVQMLVERSRDEWVDKAEELAAFKNLCHGTRGYAVCEESIIQWLGNITYRMKKNGSAPRSNHATAYYGPQAVKFNPPYINRSPSDSELYDTILHEQAHLFTAWFYGSTGHDNVWRAVARIIGCVPIGCTGNGRRERRLLKYSEVWVNQDLRKGLEQAAQTMVVEEETFTREVALGIVGLNSTGSLHVLRKLENPPPNDKMNGWRPVCNIGVRHGVADSIASVVSNVVEMPERGTEDWKNLWQNATCKVCNSRRHKVV